MAQFQLVFITLLMALCGGWLYGGRRLSEYKTWYGKGGLSLISGAVIVAVIATLTTRF
jgi:hypothetical protein